MDRRALLNNKGVSLIELMVSLGLLLVVSLALMQTALLGISTNMKNALRDEAVNIAEMRMNQLRGLPFTRAFTHADLAPTTGVTEADVQRKFRGATVNFSPTRIISDINASHKQISITVTWNYRGQSYSHGIMTIMKGQDE